MGKRKSRARVAVLVGVHLAIAAHVIHGRLAGRTLAPLELNEALYTLHAGVITAGAIFFGVAVLATAIFGRFFCGWGCHFLAFQDACGWILRKLGIRPQALPSRFLAWAPLGVMLYLFVWPRLVGPDAPPLHTVEGSFATENVWRNLPGLGVAVLTFLACGAALVLLLGTRAFCRHACPWGAVFSLADRVAPGRIVLRGDCSSCGGCTAACPSHVPVLHELKVHGKVASADCLKCMACVDACPTGALRFGFAAPPKPFRRRYRLPWREELLMAGMSLGSLAFYRGIHGEVPLLLAVGLSLINGWLAVVALRLAGDGLRRLRPLLPALLLHFAFACACACACAEGAEGSWKPLDTLPSSPFEPGGGGGGPPPDPDCEGPCPDLVLFPDRTAASLRVEKVYFPPDACSISDGCVAGPGERRLLRFDTETRNVGEADLILPEELRQENECRGDRRLSPFASFALLDGEGAAVTTGGKDAFCVMDSERIDESASARPRFECRAQGLSAGWADVYGSRLDCQWLDVTGLSGGDYELEVVVDPEALLPDGDRGNNTVRVPVRLEADPDLCLPEEERCGDGRDQDCDGEADDGCPPIEGNADCGSAHPIESGIFTAAVSGSGESCGAGGPVAYFRLELARPEIVYLATFGSDSETSLSLRGGCEGEELCAGACGGAQLARRLEAGTWIVGVRAKEPGLVRLEVLRSSCDARPLEGPGVYQGDTGSAPAETLTSCGVGEGSEERFFFATCPGAGPVSISTCGALFDTVLELKRGGCDGPPISGWCNDDGCAPASRMTGTLEGPGIFFLTVDGYGPSDRGAYELRIEW